MPLILPCILALPFIEIFVLVAVAQRIGFFVTLGLVLAASLLGLLLARRQGLAALGRLRKSLEAGQPPLRESFDALATVVAGMLLILPGLVSDVMAILLLLPPARKLVYDALLRRADRRRAAGPTPSRPRGPAPTIEGQYEEVAPPGERG